ncbi:MAG: hypothetical protein ACOC3Z_01330 [Nanoarchaeota archaeon]
MALENIKPDNEGIFPIEFINNPDNSDYEIWYKGKKWGFNDLKEYILFNKPLISTVCIGVSSKNFFNAEEQANKLKSILNYKKR